MENLCDNQGLLKLVIISFILLSFRFAPMVVLLGQIRTQSPQGVKC